MKYFQRQTAVLHQSIKYSNDELKYAIYFLLVTFFYIHANVAIKAKKLVLCAIWLFTLSVTSDLHCNYL